MIEPKSNTGGGNSAPNCTVLTIISAAVYVANMMTVAIARVRPVHRRHVAADPPTKPACSDCD